MPCALLNGLRKGPGCPSRQVPPARGPGSSALSCGLQALLQQEVRGPGTATPRLQASALPPHTRQPLCEKHVCLRASLRLREGYAALFRAMCETGGQGCL